MGYLSRVWSIKFTLAILILMQIFDVLSTILALRAGATEDNPLMRMALNDGAAGLIAAKLIVIALVFLAIAFDSLRTVYVPAALMLMNVVYGTVLSLNFASYAVLTGDWILATAFWGLMISLAIIAINEAFFEKHGATRTH